MMCHGLQPPLWLTIMLNIFNIIVVSRMRFQELGYEIRKARLARKMTQAALAKAANLSRTTLNQLENGLFPDLGVKKLQKLLEHVGLTLKVQPKMTRPRPDYIRMAATTASVSYREALIDDELIHALLSGKIPAGKKSHFRTLLDEARPALLQGMVREASHWSKPGRLEKNLEKIARDAGASRRIDEWLKNAF